MTVNWGLISSGDDVEVKSVPALTEVKGSRLAAIMMQDIVKAEESAQKYGAKRYYDNLNALLEDTEIDAVYVATPVYLHARHTIEAARHGKHVLCEKPMAMTVKECEEMIRACDDNKVQLMVTYYRRWYPAIVEMKKLLDEGRIGQPMSAKVQVFGMYHPPADGSVPWRLNAKMAGGGFLIDVGSHFIDLLIYLLGDVEDVFAFNDTLHFNLDVEDSSSLIIRFSSGPHAMACFSITIGGVPVEEVEIAGTKGRIVASNITTTGGLTIYTEGQKTDYSFVPPPIRHFGLVNNFVESITAGKKNSLSGEEALKTAKVVEAAYQFQGRKKLKA